MKQVSLDYPVRPACCTGPAGSQSAVLKAAERLRRFG